MLSTQILADYRTIIQTGEDIYSEINSILNDDIEMGPLLTAFNAKRFGDLLGASSQADSKTVFGNLVRGEIKSLSTLLKELNTCLEGRSSLENRACEQLLSKKSDLESVWSDLVKEKARLQRQNNEISSRLTRFIKMRDRLMGDREYITLKFSEYGDEDGINELFELWSAEYDKGKIENETLAAEYEQTLSDEINLPRLCGETKKYIEDLKDDINLARYEAGQILKAIPDLEERAIESEKVVLAYEEVHVEYEKSFGIRSDLKEKFERISRDKNETEKRLAESKEKLAPLVAAESGLKSELEEVTERFNRQNDLNEKTTLLSRTIAPLEKKIEDWKGRIENFENRYGELNRNIETLKTENGELTSELKKCEAMVGPVKELKERLENSGKEIVSTDEQVRKLSDEIRKVRKENETLSIKARQFEMVKKRMRGMK